MPFFGAFFDPSSLSKQAYSRLPDSEDSSEPPSPTTKPGGRSFCSKHRFILFSILACLCLVIFLPVIRYTELPDFDVLNKWHEEVNEENANSTNTGPILGSGKDASQFYFPPIGNDFRPHVAPYNYPPEERPRTPLLLPFTRNNDMLRQAVLGWIAAGWPREDIIIIDNTGTMNANDEGLLSHDNPFFIDYPLYRSRYGVSILQAPTLLNFAQLQNFFLRLALAEKWPYFFWSHMDVGVLSDEAAQPYKSFYARVLDVLDETTAQHPNPNITWARPASEMRNTTGDWAIKFFEFDNLSLINVAAWRRIGAWDVFVPYYNTDCDAYARILLHGYTKDEVSAGHIFDVADQAGDTPESLEALFFPAAQLHLNATQAAAQLARYRVELAARLNPNMTAEHLFSDRPRLLDDPDNRPNSPRFQSLLALFRNLQARKQGGERNSWQDRQKGGKGEPWTYDPRGFQRAWWETAGYGRDLYTKKWGTLDCGLPGKGLEDAWGSEYAEEEREKERQKVEDDKPDAASSKVEEQKEGEGAHGIELPESHVEGDGLYVDQRRSVRRKRSDLGVQKKRWIQRASSGEWYLG
ncbi:hypothetical protein SLS57_009767 [Botryosphaeria dothidea]